MRRAVQVSDLRIEELKAVVVDEDKPLTERRQALRLIAQLRGEPDTQAASIPEGQLRLVVLGMTAWDGVLGTLSLRDSAEAVAAGFARRGQETRRR